MGKGLGLSKDSKGNYVAWAAGTGIFVYVDLVVRLILSKTDALDPQYRLNEDFKLILFVSYASKKDALALDLLEKAQ